MLHFVTLKNACWFSLLSILFLVLPLSLKSQDLELKVLDYWPYYQQNAENNLYNSIVEDALKQLEDRKTTVESLKTAEDWRNYQQTVRQKLDRIIGPFPDKTPLNPRITETIERNKFKVELVVMESRPDYRLTGALFIPKKGPRKKPAVIYCSGHTPLSFRSEAYQRVILNLVHKGFVVFAFDPVGQGERIQYFLDDGQPSMGSTHQHSFPGAQGFLAGQPLVKYFIWDGIRAVDYLLTRSEVDPKRIGITGRSGGGTQSTQIAAFDDRILAAAPENYITSYEFLLKSRGPQDAEQNFPDFLEQQLDHADLITVRGTKPYLVSATTRDIFSIQGVRNTIDEVQKMYQILGAPDNFAYTVDDNVHTSTLRNREATYAFFMKHLKVSGDSEEEEVELFPVEALQVTPSGQALTSYNGLNIRQLIARDFERKKAEDLTGKVQELLGYNQVKQEHTVVFSGRRFSDGLTLENYIIEVEEEKVLPILVLYDSTATELPKEGVLMISDGGKSALSSEWVAQEVKSGRAVIMADLPGVGELGPGYLAGDSHIDKNSYNQWFGSILVGKSIMAYQMQALDVINSFSRDYLNQEKLYGLARGNIGLTLLHHQFLSDSYEKIALVETPASYQEALEVDQYDPSMVWYWAEGAATWYDPVELLAEDRVNWIRPVNSRGDIQKPNGALELNQWWK